MSKMNLKVICRIGKQRALYIPKSIAEALRIDEGTLVKLQVVKGKLVVKPLLDPFKIALEYPKFAKTTFREIEETSEEIQHEIFKSQSDTNTT